MFYHKFSSLYAREYGTLRVSFALFHALPATVKACKCSTCALIDLEIKYCIKKEKKNSENMMLQTLELFDILIKYIYFNASTKCCKNNSIQLTEWQLSGNLFVFTYISLVYVLACVYLCDILL